MTEKEYREKMITLEEVKQISSKLFRKTGHIAYYGAICGTRELQKEYYKDYNNINER